MLDPALIVRLSGRPSREVQWLSLVIPNPGPVVEDVRQANPEAQVPFPAPSADLVQNCLILILGINLNQIATTLLALSS